MSESREQFKVTLDAEDIEKCKSFATRFTNDGAAKSNLDFGSTDVNSRDNMDRTADALTGKLAEVAFQKYCNKEKKQIDIDFEITDGRMNIDDGQDITMYEGRPNSIKCDIKGVKSYAQWLMVESHKLDENIIIADVYIIVKLELPSNLETNLDNFKAQKIEAEVAGYAFRADFFDDEGTPWFRYKANSSPLKQCFVDILIKEARKNLLSGEKLNKKHLEKAYRTLKRSYTSTGMMLKMKQKASINYGIPITSLRRGRADFDLLFKLLNEQELPSAGSPIFK